MEMGHKNPSSGRARAEFRVESRDLRYNGTRARASRVKCREFHSIRRVKSRFKKDGAACVGEANTLRDALLNKYIAIRYVWSGRAGSRNRIFMIEKPHAKYKLPS